MGLHRNARLGLAGRRALVADVEAGCSCREAARRRGVSPTTACKWWRRWSEATPEQRRSLACLEDRSSRPHRCPRLLAAAEQARICAARRRTGWGPRLIAGETGHPHATVWRALRRAGISRPPKQPREQPRAATSGPAPATCCTSTASASSASAGPGHAVTGDRHGTGAEKRMRVGYEWVHSLVDDHSRLAYSELHRDERAATVTGFVERGLAAFASHGIEHEAADERQRLDLHAQPRARELLARTRDPPPADPPAARRSTARSSATSRRSNASGRSARSTAPATTAPKRCHTGSATTTSADRTARSAAGHRSAASTTSRGRTPSAPPWAVKAARR